MLKRHDLFLIFFFYAESDSNFVSNGATDSYASELNSCLRRDDLVVQNIMRWSDTETSATTLKSTKN